MYLKFYNIEVTSKVLKDNGEKDLNERESYRRLPSEYKTEDNRIARAHSKNPSIVSYFEISELNSPAPLELKITSIFKDK